ncbi:MAG TPA: DoxX family protein [Longimicrobium sp.]|nr:DoxX family protein [Longimicrobium sp.]
MSATLAQDATRARGTGKAANVALWVLQVAAAAMLGMAGFAKLTGNPDMVAMFDAIGVGQWFRYATGGLEVLGAILLLVPALAGAGALMLAGVMAGAILTHLFVIGGSPAIPLVLLIVLAIIAYARRERTLRLLGR